MKLYWEARSLRAWGAQPRECKDNNQYWSLRRQIGWCYKYGKKGHFARDRWHKDKTTKENVVTLRLEESISEDK